MASGAQLVCVCTSRAVIMPDFNGRALVTASVGSFTLVVASHMRWFLHAAPGTGYTPLDTTAELGAVRKAGRDFMTVMSAIGFTIGWILMSVAYEMTLLDVSTATGISSTTLRVCCGVNLALHLVSGSAAFSMSAEDSIHKRSLARVVALVLSALGWTVTGTMVSLGKGFPYDLEAFAGGMTCAITATVLLYTSPVDTESTRLSTCLAAVLSLSHAAGLALITVALAEAPTRMYA